jgi:hypothetical protein
MAFMMPVMRKNYNIYGDRGRKVSGETVTIDGSGRKVSQPSNIPPNAGSRRRVRSEGPSMSTSPAAVGPQEAMSPAMRIPTTKGSSKPIMMRRVRGSAPILAGGGGSVPIHHRHK